MRRISVRLRVELRRYVAFVCQGTGQTADELVDAILERAGREANELQAAPSLRAGLYRLAHERCLVEGRAEPLADPSPRRLRRYRLPDDLRRLPAAQCTALVLRESAMLSYEELAYVLQQSVSEVQSTLVSGRIALAEFAQARAEQAS